MKDQILKKGIVLLILLFSLSTCLQTYSQNLEVRIDSLIQKEIDKNGPGGVFLVSKGGVPVYRKAFGKSNLELDVDMNPENVFQIGSLTKQFTSIAILMLVEQGKINLDDEITKFIPDYPTQEQSITIHNLLTHTSGIKDYTSMGSIMKIAKNDLTPAEIIDFFKNEPMDFKAGDKYKYNNSGYAILGFIIELISGMTYEEFIEINIFQRIGMNSSRYASDKEIVKNRAYGYHKRDEFTNKRYISLNLPYASGSLMSCVDDMLLWQKAIKNNLLISTSTIEKAFTKYTLNNGEFFTYGYGWHLKEIEGTPSREHGGSIFGFKAMGVYLPDEDIYVIGLSNCDCISPTQLSRDIAKLAIEYL